MLSTERSAFSTRRRHPERSNPRKMSGASVGQRATSDRCEPREGRTRSNPSQAQAARGKTTEQSVLLTRRKSIKRGAIQARCRALSVDRGAIRGQHRAGSCKAWSNPCIAGDESNQARSNPRRRARRQELIAEQSAVSSGDSMQTTEQSVHSKGCQVSIREQFLIGAKCEGFGTGNSGRFMPATFLSHNVSS